MDDVFIQFIIVALQNRHNEKELFEIDVLQHDEIQRIQVYTGLLLSGYKRVLDNYAVRHIFKNHGDETVENRRGQVAILPEDFLIIPAILTQFQTFSIEKSRIGNLIFRYTFQADEHRFVYAEEVRTGRRELAVLTFYKQKIRKPT